MKNQNSFVATIDVALAEKLKGDLLEQGFTLAVPPYTLFSAQKKGVSCTLYQSGKLVVQGKEKQEFISFYLEPEILQNLTFSYPELHTDLTPRIGIDESGKGDFFGPLCVAGVQANEEKIKILLDLGVKDSKQLSDQRILNIARSIRSQCPHAIVRISPQRYNELYQKFSNLNRLLAWGHATAITELVEKTSCRKVIIDQFASEHLVISALAQKDTVVDLTQRVRGEEDIVVAAASILARAAFVDEMEKLSVLYGVTLPKGANHMVIQVGKELVAKHGVDVLAKIGKLHFKTKDLILGHA